MVDFRQPFRGDYGISQYFGETITDPKGHTGIDYLTPMGTEILASADGTVYLVGKAQSGYGNFIILKHSDGSGTVYAHLSEVLVRDGQSVRQGDLIALSGSTGKSTGPHLHFEYRRKYSDINTVEDPRTHLRSVLDTEPINPTPTQENHGFEPVQCGTCIVVADVVNVRCHCDMSRVIGTMRKGDVINIGDQVTEYMGLPFRDFYHPGFSCWLRIAEHDPDTQLIENYDIPF